jgi:hypothetical protein
MPRSRLSLIEFPADDAARARRFWVQLLGVELGHLNLLSWANPLT